MATDDKLRRIAALDQCEAVIRDGMDEANEWLESVVALYEIGCKSGNWGGYDTFEEYMDSIGQLEALRMVQEIFRPEDCDGR